MHLNVNSDLRPRSMENQVGGTRWPLTVGVGGPVGSGKTALVDTLCKRLRETLSIAVVTNDIYTDEDAEFLMRSGALSVERIRGVRTGGCPHSAIREDASTNQDAMDEMVAFFPDVQVVFIESGGDKVPRKGGPGITRSDLLVINKTDLTPYVGADLGVMDRDARLMRGDGPFIFTNLKTGDGVDQVIAWLRGKLPAL